MNRYQTMRMALAVAAVLVAAPSVRAQDAAPTFSKDIAPIFYKSCVNCHRPGQIAPMSLLTYDTARPWARSIKDRVAKREMPPWHVDQNIGITEYKDDPSLSDDQIRLVSRWVDNGA